ncbi:MAG: CvpA family protein [Bacteroidota bacterium]
MNWIDAFLVLILLLAVWSGWKRGFIIGALDLLTWLGSIVAGYVFYSYLAKGIDNIVTLGAWLLPVAFILTIIFARVLIMIVIKRILRIVPEKNTPGQRQPPVCMIPGLITGMIYATVIAALLLALPLNNSITRETRSSHIAITLSMQAEWANKKLAPVFDQL